MLAQIKQSITERMRDLVYAILSIPVLVLARFGTLQIPYTNQGFFCDDDEIRYPDRPSTINSHPMHVLYASIIFVLIPLSEISLAVRHSKSVISRKSTKRINPVFLKTLFFYAVYVCGVLSTSVGTNIFKRTASRLRPNFIAVCQPAKLDVLCPIGSNFFVENIICLGESRPDQHFSFPSSHASHSLYFAVFVILYLHRRFRWMNLARAFIQYTVFLVAGYICLSRVRDFKHRYADVIGGAVLGSCIALGIIHLVLFNFRHHRYHSEYEDEDEEYVTSDEKRALIGHISSYHNV